MKSQSVFQAKIKGKINSNELHPKSPSDSDEAHVMAPSSIAKVVVAAADNRMLTKGTGTIFVLPVTTVEALSFTLYFHIEKGTFFPQSSAHEVCPIKINFDV